jgi:hypothetical protein
MEDSAPVTAVLDLPGWTLAYSEIAPEAYTYTGAWTRRWIDFGTDEPMTTEEVVAAQATDRAILEEHGVILSIYLWKSGEEEESQRWLLDITVYPRPDVYSSQAVTHPSWFWPFLAGLLSFAGISAIFGKGGGDSGGGGMSDMISSIMAMMMMFMMMAMFMPLMSGRQ